MRWKISTCVDGGTSGHVKRAQTGSEDPHWHERKFFLTIITVNILYVKILVPYWGLKRKLSTIRKQTRGDENDQKRKLEISKKVHMIVVSLNNSKYVIIVVSTFTICWIPWILNVFYDILFHQLGSYQHSIGSHCRIFTEETFHLHITIYNEFQGRNFISFTKEN